MSSNLFSGKRVLITRAKEQADEMAKWIRENEGKPIISPVLRFNSVQLSREELQVIGNLRQFQWIIFTSVNAVQAFFERLKEAKVTLPNAIKIAVVGKKTAKTLQDYGYSADLIPQLFNGLQLAHELSTQVKAGESLLMPVGQLSRPDLQDALVKQGIRVVPMVVYETVKNFDYQEELINLFTNKKVDVITFTSPSSVRFFVELVSEGLWKEMRHHFILACIGTTTAEALEVYDTNPEIVPAKSTAKALVEAIMAYYKEDSSCLH